MLGLTWQPKTNKHTGSNGESISGYVVPFYLQAGADDGEQHILVAGQVSVVIDHVNNHVKRVRLSPPL